MPHLEPPRQPFFGAPRLADDGDNRSAFAFIGLPVGSPYDADGIRSPSRGGADHVRAMSYEQECQDEADHYDFDLDGPLMPSGTRPSLIDYGDVVTDVRDLEAGKRFATGVVRSALEGGALPFVIGGDHSISPIVARAYEAFGSFNLLHVDAHLDFRDEVGGVRDGYSSPVRRIREMPWFRSVVQVGLRGVGSARSQEVREAQEAGNTIIKADDLHDRGVPWVLEQMPWDVPWYVTIDVDGLDPTIAPGTGYPLPGGLTYRQIAALVRAVASRGMLAGMDVAETHPEDDLRGLTALTILRLLVLAMGCSVRASGREDSVLPLRLTTTRPD